jgi:hypothetical protein
MSDARKPCPSEVGDEEWAFVAPNWTRRRAAHLLLRYHAVALWLRGGAPASSIGSTWHGLRSDIGPCCPAGGRDGCDDGGPAAVREACSGLDLNLLRKSARHAKLDTTALCFHAEDERWHEAVQDHRLTGPRPGRLTRVSDAPGRSLRRGRGSPPRPPARPVRPGEPRCSPRPRRTGRRPPPGRSAGRTWCWKGRAVIAASADGETEIRTGSERHLVAALELQHLPRLGGRRHDQR